MLIKLIMIYGLCASKENVKRVFKFQKRAARVMLNADMGERSRVLLERLNWLPLKDEINLLRCKLLFRLITKAGCPSHITELLPRNSDALSSIVRLVVMRIVI